MTAAAAAPAAPGRLLVGTLIVLTVLDRPAG
jgi:hypothetical protein